MLRFCLSCVLLTGLFGIKAQDPFYINYDVKDGLPSSEIYDVEVDQNGLVWFTTDRGVCTYDGYVFKTYTTSHGMTDNTNFEIYRDLKNRLWFNGFSGRVSIFENGTFQHFAYNETLLSVLKSKWIEHIYGGNSGELYFTNTLSNFPRVFSFSEKDSIIQAEDFRINDKLDSLKVEAGHFIYKDDFAFFFYRESENAVTRYLNHLVPRIDGNWLGLSSRRAALYNQKGVLQQSYTLKNQDAVIDNYYYDSNGDLWILSSEGIFYFKNADLNQTPIRYFKDFRITSMSRDQEGNFWLSTLANGVLFVPSFEVKILKPSFKNTDKYLAITALENHILVGNDLSGVISINKQEEPEFLFQRKGEKLWQVKDFIVWPEKSIYIYPYQIIERENSLQMIERGEHLIELLRANGDLVWFRNSTITVNRDEEKKIFVSSKIRAVAEDQQARLWIGTMNGAYVIDGNQYAELRPVLRENQSMIGRVNNIHVDAANNVWMATIGEGLYCYANDQLISVSKYVSFNSEMVSDVVTSGDSTAWIATNKGLNSVYYDFTSKEPKFFDVRSFTTKDGLSSNYINGVEAWNERIWLATNDGICHFSPQIIKQNFPLVTVFINDLVVNDSVRNTKEDLKLKHYENDLLIEFTGISFRKSEDDFFYRYRLRTNHNDADWYYTSLKNIRYNDLAPDKYTFEVSARNKSGEWNNQPAQINFEIKPHYTQTNWFRALIGCFIFALIALAVFFQFKRLRRRATEKSRLQEAVLKAREAELAILRNQMNPHFIFNSLNSIQNFIFKKDTVKANYYLSKFSELMRDSLQYTRVDFIPLEKEIDFLQDYLELEQMRFPKKFKYAMDIQQELFEDEYLVPSLLFQPVLENAIKHGFKNMKSKGELFFSAKIIEDNMLEIIIRDNGRGMQAGTSSTSQKHKSMGLDIVRNRIALLNKPKENHRATVFINNVLDEENKSTGLQVRFVLPLILKR